MVSFDVIATVSVEDASDRCGNCYPLKHAVLEAAESQVMASALVGARTVCEESHLIVTALAGVPVMMPLVQGGVNEAATWQVHQRDNADGEALATARGTRTEGWFSNALIDDRPRPVALFPGIEPHAKIKTISAYATSYQ